MEALVNEDRIFDKLDEIQTQNIETLVALSKLEEQIKGIPDHESRIRALEQWRWGLVGVTSLLTTGFTWYSTTRGA